MASADSSGEAGDEPDPDFALLHRLRKWRAKARASLWVKLGVCAALSVLTIVAVRAAIRRASEVTAAKRAGEGETKVPETSGVALLPALHGLSPTEARIVGTWAEGAFVRSPRARVKGTTTCRADRTFESAGTIDIAEIGTISGTFSGTWRLQGDMLIWKVNKERWSHPTISLTDVFPDGKLVEGMSFSEQLVSVSATNLITKDTESGQTFVAERVR